MHKQARWHGEGYVLTRSSADPAQRRQTNQASLADNFGFFGRLPTIAGFILTPSRLQLQLMLLCMPAALRPAYPLDCTPLMPTWLPAAPTCLLAPLRLPICLPAHLP